MVDMQIRIGLHTNMEIALKMKFDLEFIAPSLQELTVFYIIVVLTLCYFY